MALLDVRNLSVRIPTEDGVIHAVRDVSFSVDAGAFFGIVGESGSGKSVMVQSILGLVPQAQITGQALFKGRDLLALNPSERRAIRGASISMIFQDPLSSLHPQFTIGWQISEQIREHEQVTRKQSRLRAVEMLGKVGIPSPERNFDSYPHQFSGGMRQRVMIAMALSLNPALVIADEPTTALDSTVQAQILHLLQTMRDEFDATVVMITHDLNVLGRVADSMMVMYAGHKLEIGPGRALFSRPMHPYTAGLLRSSPSHHNRGEQLISIAGKPPSLLNPVHGCVFADRCPDVMQICTDRQPPVRRYADGLEASCWLDIAPSEATIIDPEAPTQRPERESLKARGPVVKARGVELTFRNRRKGGDAHVLKGVDLTIQRGETVGLVGESGCGKSTFARVLAGLIPATAGRIELDGHDLSMMSHDEWRQLRRQVQIVFQDPHGSLNPRRRVGSIIGDPFRIHRIHAGSARKSAVQQLMELVGLNPEHYNRFPAQFSGGQRQRVGIARALALNPALIICDEPVSALDVSIQAQILNLMSSLQKEFDLSYLFISHDLGVVRHVCDRIAVMDGGRIIEVATTEELHEHPQQDFTRMLLAASLAPSHPEPPSAPRLISTTPEGAAE